MNNTGKKIICFNCIDAPVEPPDDPINKLLHTIGKLFIKYPLKEYIKNPNKDIIEPLVKHPTESKKRNKTFNKSGSKKYPTILNDNECNELYYLHNINNV